jgi:GNAT superfamily N-acetyltransferase
VTIEIREAELADADAIVELIADLGHSMTVANVRERITAKHMGGPQLVATDQGRVIGLCGTNIMTVIYRPRPVGRITILEVAEDSRSRGIGRMLVDEAERRLRDAGCGMMEITSNERLVEAHQFYLHLGFDHTSKRFAKRLD